MAALGGAVGGFITAKLYQVWKVILKGLFHPACLAHVVTWFAFVIAIFMVYDLDTTKEELFSHIFFNLHGCVGQELPFMRLDFNPLL